jgi:hypothetical protein
MEKIIFIVMILFVFACNNKKDELHKYGDIYYEILQIREKYSDTSIANPKVRELLSKYGYSEEQFLNESVKLFSKDRILYTKMIDSIKRKAEEEMKNKNQ